MENVKTQILLVEDDANLGTLLQEYLEALPYLTSTHTSDSFLQLHSIAQQVDKPLLQHCLERKRAKLQRLARLAEHMVHLPMKRYLQLEYLRQSHCLVPT